MAESKGSLLAKSVQKHLGRSKEKILQNLGKVDRTADEIFDEHLTNFSRQQINATKLQKEFNNYIRCIRACQTASKSLMDAICDVYETSWSGAEALHAQVSAIEGLWQEFSHKLGDQVLIPLNGYTAQFPEMKKKIEKRNRKLIDYDGHRHSFQSLQANAAKRRDDAKVTKSREQLEEARRTYEILNTELHDELPALHDSRILFLVTNLQTLFASEQVFHNETAKIFAEFEAIVDKLATDSQRGSYTIKKLSGNSNPSSPPQSPVKLSSTVAPAVNNTSYTNTLTNGSTNGNGPSSPPSSPSPKELRPAQSTEPTTPSSQPDRSSSVSLGDSPASISPVDNEPSSPTANDLNKSKAESVKEAVVQSTNDVENSTNANVIVTNDAESLSKLANEDTNKTANETIDNANIISSTTGLSGPTVTAKHNNNKVEELYDIPAGATITDLPPGVLYRVKATYKYVKEDMDELSFEVGDTINVIEYDDPDDQEEGWLMGEKEGTTEKGLFPANFTRPL
ncbi:amphiphysin isoform X1 [Bradysia coprophila]|uniref:amphiphysin isoform X1 n=1 Tax=Bradysia coprophila TaxID=38358 RepID=UPI00187DBBC1|nr:amphiphysin isoform X1 [Bradysia coprophila]